MKPIILVVGARPNFMKIAPLYDELNKRSKSLILLHTGQHYDEKMSKVFFEDLGMPKPDIYLGVGSGTHAVQTADVMVKFEQVCFDSNPELVLVVGDVNSTLACSLVSAKLCIPCVHLEAGLRSNDREMPEEINRLVTDVVSDLLLTPSADADVNLRGEGIPESKIKRVGNIMIDSLFNNLERAKKSNLLNELNIEKGTYALMTLHRPSNVDSQEPFLRIIEAIKLICETTYVIFPIHPRTKSNAKKFGLLQQLENIEKLVLLEPLGYLDFISLMSQSKFVLTDSGGLQEETTALGIPCLTLRENTERPITVVEGTNVVVGSDTKAIMHHVNSIHKEEFKSGKIPDLWDGKTAIRISDELENFVNKR